MSDLSSYDTHLWPSKRIENIAAKGEGATPPPYRNNWST